MFCKKKRDDRVEEQGEESEINFARLVFIGMKIGYREWEIAHMYFGKWCDLFEEFKHMHNIEMRRQIFEKQKVTSLMDL